jgi:hypothetical protein
MGVLERSCRRFGSRPYVCEQEPKKLRMNRSARRTVFSPRDQRELETLNMIMHKLIQRTHLSERQKDGQVNYNVFYTFIFDYQNERLKSTA